MMGFINSIIKFNADILARLFALLYLINSGVTIEDFDNLSHAIYTAISLQFASLAVIKFLVNRNEFYSIQVVIDKID